MFKVIKKPLTPNMIWDSENNRPLCKFDKKGTLETNDKRLVEKLKALGHTVTGAADKSDEESGGSEAQEPEFESDKKTSAPEDDEDVVIPEEDKSATNAKKSTTGKSGRK